LPRQYIPATPSYLKRWEGDAPNGWSGRLVLMPGHHITRMTFLIKYLVIDDRANCILFVLNIFYATAENLSVFDLK